MSILNNRGHGILLSRDVVSDHRVQDEEKLVPNLIAANTTFPGWPHWHKRVQESRMARLWWAAFTVVMQGIVHTEVRPPRRGTGTDRCPGLG